MYEKLHKKIIDVICAIFPDKVLYSGRLGLKFGPLYLVTAFLPKLITKLFKYCSNDDFLNDTNNIH